MCHEPSLTWCSDILLYQLIKYIIIGHSTIRSVDEYSVNGLILYNIKCVELRSLNLYHGRDDRLYNGLWYSSERVTTSVGEFQRKTHSIKYILLICHGKTDDCFLCSQWPPSHTVGTQLNHFRIAVRKCVKCCVVQKRDVYTYICGPHHLFLSNRTHNALLKVRPAIGVEWRG